MKEIGVVLHVDAAGNYTVLPTPPGLDITNAIPHRALTEGEELEP